MMKPAFSTRAVAAIGAMLLAPIGAIAAPPQPFTQALPLTASEQIALTAGAAGVCGVKGKAWAHAAFEAAAMSAQFDWPHATFPTDGQMQALSLIEAGIGAAYWSGVREIKLYGHDGCRVFADTGRLAEADRYASAWRKGGRHVVTKMDKLAWIPNAILPEAWTMSRDEIAFRCGMRDAAWLRDASIGALSPLDAAVKRAGLNDPTDPAITSASQATNAMMSVGDAEYDHFGKRACRELGKSGALAKVDAAVKAWRDNPNPWAGVGKAK